MNSWLFAVRGGLTLSSGLSVEKVSPQNGDRFDLDELISISENGYSQQCARDVMSTEVAADNLPSGQKVFSILRGDVDRGFHNVGEFRPGGT